MIVLSDAPFAAARRLSWTRLAAGVLGLAMIGCRSERSAQVAAEAELVTTIQMVRPATDRVPVNVVPEPRPVDSVDEAAEYCRGVERQARETNAALPQRLDKDTSATRVVAYGCDVVLEYAMLDLRVSDVALEGVRALRGEVLQKLCSDRGARGVLEHGGSFTNVYRDDRSALIDQFTIAEVDCGDWRSAEETPARVGL